MDFKEYFRKVEQLKFDIKTSKDMLRDYKKERDMLIKASGPASLKAVSYDQPKVQTSGHVNNDLKMLIRVGELTEYISCYEEIIDSKERTLNKLKYRGKTMINTLTKNGESTAVIEVFIATVIDGMSKDEITDLGYELKTVYNARSTINKLLERELPT
jgi:hypothetical protein